MLVDIGALRAKRDSLMLILRIVTVHRDGLNQNQVH